MLNNTQSKQRILSGRMIACGVSGCSHGEAGRFFKSAKTSNIHVVENHMHLPDWRDYLVDSGESLPVSRCVTPPTSAADKSQAAVQLPETFMQAFMAQFAAMSAAAAAQVF